MHKVIGEFNSKTLTLEISLDVNHKLSSDLYTKIKNYVNNNMFLSIRRQSSKFKRIVISSVGDHLTESDEQDITKADLFIDVELLTDVSKDTYDLAMTLPCWNVCIGLQKGKNYIEIIVLQVNRSDDLIIHRELKVLQ